MAATSRAAAVAGPLDADTTAGSSVLLAFWPRSLCLLLKTCLVLSASCSAAARRTGWSRRQSRTAPRARCAAAAVGRGGVGDTLHRSIWGGLHLAITRICKLTSSTGNPGAGARMLPPAGRSNQAAFSGTACISRRPRAATYLCPALQQGAGLAVGGCLLLVRLLVGGGVGGGRQRLWHTGATTGGVYCRGRGGNRGTSQNSS